jgi:hypothetical protein
MAAVGPAKPVGNAGEGLFIASGMIVAVAGWQRNHQLGEWWWRALIGTVGLCVLAAVFSRTKAAPVVKGVAWLTFISSCIYAIPIINNPKLGKVNNSPAAKKEAGPANKSTGTRSGHYVA